MTRQIGWHRLIIVAILSLCCISSVACSDSDDSQMGIQIVDGVGSIGGDPENTEHQTLTYNWQLKNYNKEEVLLQWVQPNLSDELANRLLIDDVKVDVGKIVGSGESIEVNGVITFDASGLSKQEISEDFDITGLTISTESMVYLPGDKRG